MMNPEQAAPEAAAGAGADSNQSDKLLALNDALKGLASALNDAKDVPPEAKQALQIAAQAYGKFLSAFGIDAGGDSAEEASEPQDANTVGKNAVPADQPVSSSARPAY